MIPPVGYSIDDYDLDNQDYRDYLPNEVLKNNLGINETSLLNTAERDYSNLRFDELLSSEEKPQFNVDYYLSVHQHIFQDVYPWAGKTRVMDTAKGDSLFVPHQFIVRDLNKALIELEQNLKGSNSINDFGESLGKFLGSVNNIHPFAEGNGRTQRLYISKVANKLDFQVNWEKISNEAMKEASIKAHENDFKSVIKLITRSLEADLDINSIPEVNDSHLQSDDSYYLHYKKELDNEVITGLVTNISEKYIVLKRENAYLVLSRESFEATNLKIGDMATFSKENSLSNQENIYSNLSNNQIAKVELYKNHLLEKYTTPEARSMALEHLNKQIPDIASGKIVLPDSPQEKTKGFSR